jgi:hypothetical protein
VRISELAAQAGVAQGGSVLRLGRMDLAAQAAAALEESPPPMACLPDLS